RLAAALARRRLRAPDGRSTAAARGPGARPRRRLPHGAARAGAVDPAGPRGGDDRAGHARGIGRRAPRRHHPRAPPGPGAGPRRAAEPAHALAGRARAAARLSWKPPSAAATPLSPAGAEI